MLLSRTALRTLLLFLLATGAYLYLHADRWLFKPEEGIYLSGGEQILNGRLPYRDFFALTGPGTFWLHALVFRIAGVSLWAGRLIPAFAIAGLSAAVFRLGGGTARAALSALLFFFLAVWQPALAVNDHRWESAALAAAAIVCALPCLDAPNPRRAFAAGALIAGAVWITPPLALVGFVLAVWLRERRNVAGLLAGAGVVGLAGIVALGMSGSLGPFVDHMLWVRRHYAGANRVPYGSVNGGYAELFAGSGIADVAVRAPVILCFALPALLPPLLAAAVWRSRRREDLFLFSVIAALIASTYPRWDLAHLLQISAPALALACGLLFASRGGGVALAGLTLVAGLLFVSSAAQRAALVKVETRVGRVSVDASQAELVHLALARIRPGESAFVFPFMPSIYFLCGARPVSRFPFLQPGMMTLDDERSAVAELRAKPPHWIVFFDLPDSAWLESWPGSDPARVRLPLLRQLIGAEYREVAATPHGKGTVRLLQHAAR